MNDSSLRQLLAQVHERLSRAPSIDAPTRELLTTVMRDIEATRSRAGTDAAAVTPRIESLAVRFETEHPGLAEALRELIDTLGKAGI